ncbi:hypothetical protein EJ04DRAFT_557268 [Polyplosphaeria fusca]|uniref:Uncharacterized protein n=1 Tax=Polyplosphaeria fusca TaxID=682080 RepID=A0A9P4QJT6_9PLEO|nr:hypothetical protein EJ04DRAFT_557268 [Polyplosphaeria fusca]
MAMAYYRWENPEHLKHHCGWCDRPLHHPEAIKTCFGDHSEPCARFHQMMFMRNCSHRCDVCKAMDHAHRKRHMEICEALRDILRLCGLDTCILPAIEDRRDQNIEEGDDTRPPEATTNGGGGTNAEGASKETKRERKERKALVKAALRPKFLTSVELKHIHNVLHPDAEDDSVSAPKSNEEVEEIAQNLQYNAHLFNSAGFKRSALQSLASIKEANINFEAEMDRILITLNVVHLFNSGAISRRFYGKDLKDFDTKISGLKKMIVDDLVTMKRDQMEMRMRRAGFLRYVSTASYLKIVERHTEQRSWSTGERIRKSEESEQHAADMKAAREAKKRALESQSGSFSSTEALLKENRIPGLDPQTADLRHLGGAPMATNTRPLPAGPMVQPEVEFKILNVVAPGQVQAAKADRVAVYPVRPILGDLEINEQEGDLGADQGENKSRTNSSASRLSVLTEDYTAESSASVRPHENELVVPHSRPSSPPPISNKKMKKKKRNAEAKARKQLLAPSNGMTPNMGNEPEPEDTSVNEASASSNPPAEADTSPVLLEQTQKVNVSAVPVSTKNDTPHFDEAKSGIAEVHEATVVEGLTAVPKIRAPVDRFDYLRKLINFYMKASDEQHFSNIISADGEDHIAGDRIAGDHIAGENNAKSMSKVRSSHDAEWLGFESEFLVDRMTDPVMVPATCTYARTSTPNCTHHYGKRYNPMADLVYLIVPGENHLFSGPFNRIRAEKLLDMFKQLDRTRGRVMLLDLCMFQYLINDGTPLEHTNTWGNAVPNIPVMESTAKDNGGVLVPPALLEEKMRYRMGYPPGKLMIQESDLNTISIRNNVLSNPINSEELMKLNQNMEPMPTESICYCDGPVPDDPRADFSIYVFHCAGKECKIRTFHLACIMRWMEHVVPICSCGDPCGHYVRRKCQTVPLTRPWYCYECEAAMELAATLAVQATGGEFKKPVQKKQHSSHEDPLHPNIPHL